MPIPAFFAHQFWSWRCRLVPLRSPSLLSLHEELRTICLHVEYRRPTTRCLERPELLDVSLASVFIYLSLCAASSLCLLLCGYLPTPSAPSSHLLEGGGKLAPQLSDVAVVFLPSCLQLHLALSLSCLQLSHV